MKNINNKALVKKAHLIIKELGHKNFPLGYVYELLSRLYGFKNWKVASAQSVDFGEILEDYPFSETIGNK